MNGKKQTAELTDTNGEWAVANLDCRLKKGENTVELRLTDDLSSKVYIDCITMELTEAGGAGVSPVVIAVIAAVAVILIAVVAAVMLIKKKK